LMSEELLDGDLTYPDDGPLLILPEKKEVKVTYKPDSIDEKQKDEQEE
jgi:hypothetical protein